MSAIKAAIKRHAVLIYFGLAFVLSGGGMLLVVGPAGFPLDATQFASSGPLLYAAGLAGPCVAGILLTVALAASQAHGADGPRGRRTPTMPIGMDGFAGSPSPRRA